MDVEELEVIKKAPDKPPKKEKPVDKFYRLAKNIIDEENIDKQEAHIIVRYPKVEITNSKGHKHTIHELFVRVTIDPYSLSVRILEGCKWKYSAKEVLNQYVHSHLSSFSGTSWKQFCLSRNPIKMMFNKSLEDEQIVYFFHLLNNYVKWESLEGGPYRKILNIKNIHTQYLNIEHFQDIHIVESCLKDLFKINHIKLNFSLTDMFKSESLDNFFTIDKKHKEFLSKYSKYLVYVNDNGSFSAYINSDSDESYYLKLAKQQAKNKTTMVMSFKGRVYNEIEIFDDIDKKEIVEVDLPIKIYYTTELRNIIVKMLTEWNVELLKLEKKKVHKIRKFKTRR